MKKNILVSILLSSSIFIFCVQKVSAQNTSESMTSENLTEEAASNSLASEEPNKSSVFEPPIIETVTSEASTEILDSQDLEVPLAPFDARLSSVGQKALPGSLSGDDIAIGSPDLRYDKDWWEHINNLVSRRFIENYFNDLFKGKNIGFRKGDSVTIDLTGLFGNSNGYNSDIAWKESKTNYNGMYFLPGNEELWFVIDATDTINNPEKKNWLNKGWRSANNTKYNDGLIVTTSLNQYYSGTTEDGLFSWKVEHGFQWRPQSITVTRNKTTFSDENITSILKFGKVSYANEVNTRDWNGDRWENRAGEKRWGDFYPQIAVNSSGAPELKVSQKTKPIVREGERVQDILTSKGFNVEEYLDIKTASSDSKVECRVVDSSIILDGKNNGADVEIIETLDGLTRTKRINFMFDVKEYTLNMSPLTNLNRKLTDIESINENSEVSKLDSPVTTALNGSVELESDMNKYGDYELLVKFSGSGISKEKYISLTAKEQQRYSFDEKLGDINLFAGKPVNIELLYRQAGEDRVVRKLKTLVPLDATPPDGKLVDEVVTTIGEVPNSKKIAIDLKDETSHTVDVSYISDIDKLVSEPSTIKDGVVSLKELSVKLKDEAGNTRQLEGNILAVLAEKIWLELPKSVKLHSKELIMGAKDLPSPSVMQDRTRITDEDFVKLLVEKGIKGYYYEAGKINELTTDELDFFGLQDVTYEPAGSTSKEIKVTGRHKDLISDSESIDIYVLDGKLELLTDKEIQFKSKLSTKLTNQTELSSRTDLIIRDKRYAEDGWQINATASEFITNDGKNTVIKATDMDLMARIEGQADQSLITNGGVNLENTTDKNKQYDLSDKNSGTSLYLTTKKSQGWAKLNTTYTTTINWELNSSIKIPEAQFLVPKPKKGVD